MMRSHVMALPGHAAGAHCCLAAARGAAAGAAASGPADGRSLAVSTLVSWLLTEALGAYMLRSWILSGGARQSADHDRTASRSLVFGHACLAASGFACWVSFLITGLATLAWISIGLLAPAIGLGISTVTVWTPFPARTSAPEDEVPLDQASQPSLARPGSVSDEVLTRALADEAMTRKLIDDMLAGLLAEPSPAPRQRVDFAPLIPAAHGLLAIGTFSLAMLAAIGAIS
jgi:hypothetical protein